MIKLSVFSSDKTPGVDQYLHPVREGELKEISPKITDQFDHSFFFFNQKTNTVNVRWFNHHGEIQLCGSGAYATSKYIFEKYELSEINLKTQSKTLKANNINGVTSLSLPLIAFEHREKRSPNNMIYSYPSRGIYLIQVADEKSLIGSRWQDLFKF
ncbi:hypothetical protein N9N67_08520, partial [Bacteriovoracaceae bacterium]|nr:hypothetical protein [Bacteriovoracaceae bacterium]